ncbi:MAG: hypothetical protein QM724_12130 [Flavobacteriales bacterium]
MRNTLLLSVLPILAACGGKSPAPQRADTASAPRTWAMQDLPAQDDNVRDDTLVIYTTHALGNGTFVMAAKSMQDTREGLRLVLYRPRPDSSAEVLATSAPAYDSWTMLPTFFSTGDTTDGWLVLANFGERQSWGQKVFLLKGHHFEDLGFIDVAERGWRTEDDSTYQWRTSIAPRVQVQEADGVLTFSFSGDSVQVYDDLAGHQEVMLPVGRVQYRYDGKAFTLVIDGEARAPKAPA